MNAHMDLQMMIVRKLQLDRLADTDVRRLTRHALRPPVRDASRHGTHGLAASYARTVPFAGVELIEQRGRS